MSRKRRPPFPFSEDAAPTMVTLRPEGATELSPGHRPG